MNFSDKNLNEVLETIGTDIANCLLKLNNFEGIVFPPIEYSCLDDLTTIFRNYNKIFKLNPKYSCKFAEFQIKIKMKNYSKIKEFIDFLFKEFKKFDNFAITLYFYNIKQNSVLKMTENLLTKVYEKLKERKISHFFLKLFLWLHENNSVEYKYFIFQENTDYLIQKSGDSFNSSKILKTSLTVKVSKNNKNTLLNTKDKCSSILYVNLKFYKKY